MQKNKLTPLMRQYFEIKNKYPNTLLMFQVGDFYEFFYEDAELASKFLGIALTQRGLDSKGEPIALCGIPVHVLDHYITKLVKGGFRVAVCDQLEPPKPGKVVERGVTQVLTPGTLTDTKLLDSKSASYLCIFFPGQVYYGLFFVEILTGQLFITKFRNDSKKVLESELNRFMPDEIIVPDIKISQSYIPFFQQLGFVITKEFFKPYNDFNNNFEESFNWFIRQYSNSEITELVNDETFKSSLLLLYSFLKKNNERALSELKQLFIYYPEDYLMLDSNTQRNLELVKNLQDNSNKNTLFSVIDRATTPMGSRLLKKWVLRPLIKKDLIEHRLDAVETLKSDLLLRTKIQKSLKEIGDLERVVGRIALSRTHLYDYLYLLNSLKIVPEIKNYLSNQLNGSLLEVIHSKIADFTEICFILDNSLNDDNTQNWLIKKGYNNELDKLRLLVEDSNKAILEFESKEQTVTNISSLKIRYNGTHGYAIEITKPNVHLVPDNYIHIQSLTNRERYTTQELKDLEYDITRARNQVTELENDIYNQIKSKVETYLSSLKKLTQSLAYLDALISLAEIAYLSNYSRPTFNDKRNIIIKDGRHPVIESHLHSKFIPNSTTLTDDENLWIITGPNMGGKSTYLRQVALIIIMAQMGSFVPASNAELPIIDRIFTRIGAADNVSDGKSTFLVEMEETATICNESTPSSLVILDEVGRGTSTFDGIAIAQAVVEYIFNTVKARCLFATHFHELTALSEKHKGISCYYTSSTKTDDSIVLLHKILPGVAQGSFGLEVAKVAMLPFPIIQRAYTILNELLYLPTKKMEMEPDDMKVENWENTLLLRQKISELETYIDQLKNKIEHNQAIINRLLQIDYEHLTAKQAYDLLWHFKEKLNY